MKKSQQATSQQQTTGFFKMDRYTTLTMIENSSHPKETLYIYVKYIALANYIQYTKINYHTIAKEIDMSVSFVKNTFDRFYVQGLIIIEKIGKSIQIKPIDYKIDTNIMETQLANDINTNNSNNINDLQGVEIQQKHNGNTIEIQLKNNDEISNVVTTKEINDLQTILESSNNKEIIIKKKELLTHKVECEIVGLEKTLSSSSLIKDSLIKQSDINKAKQELLNTFKTYYQHHVKTQDSKPYFYVSEVKEQTINILNQIVEDFFNEIPYASRNDFEKFINKSFTWIMPTTEQANKFKIKYKELRNRPLGWEIGGALTINEVNDYLTNLMNSPLKEEYKEFFNNKYTIAS